MSRAFEQAIDSHRSVPDMHGVVCGGARKIVGVALLRALGKIPIVERWRESILVYRISYMNIYIYIVRRF